MMAWTPNQARDPTTAPDRRGIMFFDIRAAAYSRQLSRVHQPTSLQGWRSGNTPGGGRGQVLWVHASRRTPRLFEINVSKRPVSANEPTSPGRRSPPMYSRAPSFRGIGKCVCRRATVTLIHSHVVFLEAHITARNAPRAARYMHTVQPLHKQAFSWHQDPHSLVNRQSSASSPPTAHG